VAIADQLALPRVEGDVNTPLPCGQAHATDPDGTDSQADPHGTTFCELLGGTTHRWSQELVLTPAANPVHSTCPKGR
jgi:hypothetical protein